jgi:hypothetical protein
MPMVGRARRRRELAAVDFHHHDIAAAGLRGHVALERVIQRQRMDAQSEQPLEIGLGYPALREMIRLERLPYGARQRRDRWQVQAMQQFDPQIDMAVDVRPDRISTAQSRTATPTHLCVAVHHWPPRVPRRCVRGRARPGLQTPARLQSNARASTPVLRAFPTVSAAAVTGRAGDHCAACSRQSVGRRTESRGPARGGSRRGSSHGCGRVEVGMNAWCATPHAWCFWRMESGTAIAYRR